MSTRSIDEEAAAGKLAYVILAAFVLNRRIVFADQRSSNISRRSLHQQITLGFVLLKYLSRRQ